MIIDAPPKALRHNQSMNEQLYDMIFLDSRDAFLYLFIIVVSLYCKENIEEVL